MLFNANHLIIRLDPCLDDKVCNIGTSSLSPKCMKTKINTFTATTEWERQNPKITEWVKI